MVVDSDSDVDTFHDRRVYREIRHPKLTVRLGLKFRSAAALRATLRTNRAPFTQRPTKSLGAGEPGTSLLCLWDDHRAQSNMELSRRMVYREQLGK
jgi:hypothetical protein